MKYLNLFAVSLVALILSAGCNTLSTPTGPTNPIPPVVTKPQTPDPTPPAAGPADPSPAPTPAPRKGWYADVGQEYWLPGQPDQLDGHFPVVWTRATLDFDGHSAEIIQQSNLGIFARLPAMYGQEHGYITIAFDSETHGTWNWNSPEGQAFGEITFKEY